MSNSICNKFERRFEELVESNADRLSRDLLEHAANCVTCRTLWEDLHGLDKAIALWQEQPLTTNLTDKVLAGLEQDKPIVENPFHETIPPKSRQRIWYSAATVVAALLLLVAIVPQLRFGNPNDPKLGPTHDIVDTGDVSGNLSDVISQFRNASTQFVVDAGNSASDTTMLLPNREQWPVFEQSFANLPAKKDTVSSQLVEGFSPLGSRVDRAFQNLLESVDHSSKPDLE